jgi:hypothetical protein
MFPDSVRSRAGLPLEVVHVAKLLNVCPRMVRVLVARGELPRRRRGRKILVFDEVDVIALKVRRESRGQ